MYEHTITLRSDDCAKLHKVMQDMRKLLECVVSISANSSDITFRYTDLPKAVKQ